MAEALTLHTEHEESLQKSKDTLEMANRQLMAEKELNQQLVLDKISQARHHKKMIKELQVYCLMASCVAQIAPWGCNKSVPQGKGVYENWVYGS